MTNIDIRISEYQTIYYLSKILILAIIIISIINIYCSTAVYAGGVDSLMKFASPKGTMVNVNKATIIKDQQGGYITGGSVILRGPKPKTLQPLLIQTPKFSFDACTGSADFRFGGLSFISGKEFTQFFKNTATASGSYAVKMLIKNSCPQCEDIMSYLETVARDINGMMMDQCSMGQMIGGGIYNSLTSGNQQQCLMQGNISKSSKDMYEASEKCKEDPDRHGDKGKDEELKSLLGNRFNLVWKALGNGEGGDLPFKELMMSVSGTIIGRKVDGSFEFKNKPSLVLSNDLLKQYIGLDNKSSKVKLYHCDENKHCLDPNEVETKLLPKDTIYGNITRILEGLIKKVPSGKAELTDEEQTIIAFSSVPILQLIELEISQKADSADMLVRMNEFVEVVCYDVVTTFLSQMVIKCGTAVQALEYSQLDNTAISNFSDQISEVRRHIQDSKHTAFKRLQAIMQYKERLTQQIRSFKSGFGRFIEYNTQG